MRRTTHHQSAAAGNKRCDTAAAREGAGPWARSRSFAFAGFAALLAGLMGLACDVAEFGKFFALARVAGATIAVGLTTAIALFGFAADAAGTAVGAGLALALTLPTGVARIARKASSTVGFSFALATDLTVAACRWLLGGRRPSTTGSDESETSET